MLEVDSPGGAPDDVEVLAAGAEGRGEYHCTGCGYGVTVYRELPACPMCSGTAWESAGRGPLAGVSAPEAFLV